MRNMFTAADQPTLAQVLDAIASDTALPAQRRRNLCSSIRGTGKLVGKPLEAIPASVSFLRNIYKNLHPEQCGMTLSRIRNIRSDVLFALRQVGIIGRAHTYMCPLSPEWQELWEQAACAGKLRRYVSRLMHYCSARGIGPHEVNDQVLEAFKQALIDESLIQDPITTHQGIVRTWNKLVDAVLVWPKTYLTVPRYSTNYTIPLDSFPASLQTEIAAFFHRSAGVDILDDEAPPKPLKPKTIESRRYRLRQIATALVLSGQSIDDLKSLAQIVEINAAKAALRFYLERSGNKKTSQIHGLAVLIKVIAQHWVKVSPDHLKALKDLCAKMDPQIIGMTDKNRDRLRQLDDPRCVRLLLDYPARVFREVVRLDRGRRGDAVRVQIALAVELLLMAPIRAQNLVSLEINRHIQRSRSGKGGIVHLVIPGDEVKNGEPLEFTLPPETVELLDIYLRDYHPRLAGPGCPWLFPGADGKSKTRELFGDQISKHVFKATGLTVNMHLFRHISAKLYLDRNPGGYEVCRRLLGHRSIETTTKFYAGMESASVSRHFDAEILKLRQSLRESSQPPKPEPLRSTGLTSRRKRSA